MKLFLASYQFGGHEAQLVALTGPPGRAAVIANACDELPAATRASLVQAEVQGLRRLGFTPFELDLRAGRPSLEALSGVQLLWVRGGNSFVLRTQFAHSGADAVVRPLVHQGALVYGGYSAGACIAAPSLHGLESMDDPAVARTVCGSEPVWDGLALVPDAIVPHYGSVLDPDGAAVRLAAQYTASGVPHRTLTDDQVLIVDS